MNERPIARVRSLTEPPAAPSAQPKEPAPKPPVADPGLAQPPVPAPFKPRTRDFDEEAEDAMKAEMKRPTVEARPDISLKKQWDDDLEAELNAALEGFDASALDVGGNKPRTRAGDRAHVPQSHRGQEATPGPRQAKVVALRGRSLFVDLGGKSEGVLPMEQFGNDPIPDVGSLIEVVVDRYDAEEGLVLVSLKGAAVEANWENLRKGMIVEARPTKVNKGGLEVVVDGIRGFMPIGQIDLNRVEDASIYLNQKLRAVVTEANQREKNLVVSRRELLEQEREELKVETWKTLEEGQVRPGVIRSLKPFGAFVDLGGVDGLIPTHELGWGKVNDPSEVVKMGQQVEVKIVKIDKATSRVSLSLKALLPSPWDDAEDKYHKGMTVRGKVTRLMDFGAFVELEPGIEGLIHISELASKRVFRVKDHAEVGQEVDVRILQFDADAHKISLSLRPLPVAAKPEPEEADDDTPPTPRPAPKVPLKGGLGDTDPNPFSHKPK